MMLMCPVYVVSGGVEHPHFGNLWLKQTLSSADFLDSNRTLLSCAGNSPHLPSNAFCKSSGQADGIKHPLPVCPSDP